MKRALIITYYWPPCGGAPVQRWLKFSKYLREFDWEPIIYTAENGEYPMLDVELEKEVPEGVEVLRQPVWEPYSIYKKFTGKKSEEKLKPELVTATKKSPLKENLAIWVRGNFFIPDARKYWRKPSVSYLREYLKNNHVDVIISTSSPQTDHLIALDLVKEFNIPWLADFRDPWTKVDYFNELKLSASAEKKHKQLEQEVLKKADITLTVSWAWAKDFKGLGANHVEVITNGFDTEDLPKSISELDKKFTLVHIGNLSKDRNHGALFKAVKSLIDNEKGFAEDFRLRLIGDVDPSFMANLEKYGLNSYTDFVGPVSHTEAMTQMFASQVLLLLLGAEDAGRIPLKAYEYMASHRPIAGIGKVESDVASILESTGAGKIIGFSDAEGLQKLLADYYHSYKSETLRAYSKDLEKYSRKNLTAALADILNKLTRNNGEA